MHDPSSLPAHLQPSRVYVIVYLYRGIDGKRNQVLAEKFTLQATISGVMMVAEFESPFTVILPLHPSMLIKLWWHGEYIWSLLLFVS
jgi:hypothetical protein